LEPIYPTLFEMDKLEDGEQLANSLHVESPYYEPGLLLGTSALTAAGIFFLRQNSEGLALISCSYYA
jgi:hypothetical protein